MTILQIIYSLGSGGAERFVVDLSNELSKDKSNNIVLVTIVDDGTQQNRHYLSEISENVKYICLGTKSGFHIRSFIRVFKTIRALKPDIVHAHCNLLMLYLPALLLLTRVKYFHTLHNLAEVCLRFSFLKPINRYFYKGRIKPITISDICLRSYTSLYGLKNAYCIPNGRTSVTTTAELKNVQQEINALKNTLQDKVFVHIARYGKQKNQQLLFDTFNRLYKENAQVQLLVIGAGHQDPSNLLGVPCPIIHIMGEKKNIGDYLSQADFFILSSFWEGLPISLLEAMSMGVIPVCTPAGGIPDVITDGVTGYLSPSFDNNDFYFTIKRALTDMKRIDKNKITAEYNNKYSMVECAKNYLEVYITSKYG